MVAPADSTHFSWSFELGSITIVQMMVPFRNLIQCFEDIDHDKNTKFERPGKIRRASQASIALF